MLEKEKPGEGNNENRLRGEDFQWEGHKNSLKKGTVGGEDIIAGGGEKPQPHRFGGKGKIRKIEKAGGTNKPYTGPALERKSGGNESQSRRPGGLRSKKKRKQKRKSRKPATKQVKPRSSKDLWPRGDTEKPKGMRKKGGEKETKRFLKMKLADQISKTTKKGSR